MVSARIT